jgi:lambda family phage portal protein
MDVTITPLQPMAVGGAYEGASRTSRELAMDKPSLRSPDGDILPVKKMSDARSRDIVRNDGYANGAVAIHRDSIVGTQFTLNSRPDFRVLGLDETWAEEFQREVESKFRLYAESQNCWVDASRHDTLTGLTRLAIGVYVMAGEILATAEWIREGIRPYSTAVQMIHLDRLSNPMGEPDTKNLRGGIERNRYGAPMAAHIRVGHPADPYDMTGFNWVRVPMRKPWGRLQVIHLFERFMPDQTRGIAEMVSVLKQMKMTSRYQDIVLQNAVVNATYAATIESELPREAALESIGASSPNSIEWASQYLGAISQYSEGSKNVHIDGVKIPHLFPGSKLNLRPAGQAGGVGTTFEESLLRHIAAGLGLSYEQFSRDYSKTNYSSARASMNETWKYMQGRKKMVADRFASSIFELWLEEAINAGDIKSLPKNAPSFYEGLNKEAYCQCAWIGASRGQIDELKETQAAVARIDAGLSTKEIEAARLGLDWREIFAQQAREQAEAEKAGLVFGAANIALAQAEATAAQQDQQNQDQQDQNGNAGGNGNG